MARIRTIKPETPQSQSFGRLSRDARLCFIMLWTICDDAGRARGSSRLLASLLYPYDDDAKALMEGWLDELEREECVRRYTIDGDEYLEVVKWLKHQKIDKPSPSRIPEFAEASRILSKPREASTTDLVPVPRTMDQDQDLGRDHAPAHAAEPSIDLDDIPLANDQRPEGLAVKSYNAVAAEHGWALCQTLNVTRRTKLRARLRECGGIEGWQTAMAKASASAYLRGETKRSPGYESWRPDLEFFLQQKSFTSLMEGKYDDRSYQNSRANDRAAILEGAGLGGVAA